MRVLKLMLTLTSLLLISSGLLATNYYVATNGDDNNNGSSGSPWKTIQKAANTANNGDVVYVRAGTYSGTVTIANSGVTFDGSNRQAVLNGRILAYKKSNLTIRGFKIQGGEHGIYVEGPCANITLENNHTYDTYGSGIGVWGVGWQGGNGNPYYGAAKNVKILNNKVEKACDGGWNECITLCFGVEDFLIKGNEILNGGDPINGGEGIDVKSMCRNGRIENNHVHHLTRRGIYLDGGRTCYNIVVTGNESNNNVGHGLAIMCESSGDVHDITIENNNFHNNTEDGIMIYRHPNGAGSNVYNIFIRNNTLRNNQRYGFLLDFDGVSNIQFCDNTTSGNTSGSTHVSAGSLANCTGSSSSSSSGGSSSGGSNCGNNAKAWIYQHCNYSGYSAAFNEGSYNITQIQNCGLTNDDASSIKVASGYKVTLYQHGSFGGYSWTITGDDACLNNNTNNRGNGSNWNDDISSIKVEPVSVSSSGSEGTAVHMKKRNASGFAIDGKGGGSDGQNIYLWSSNTDNVNQKWEEINRGGGYYSYKKVNTNYCIDGGNGGSNGQNVYLWTCSDGNQNQHWKKVDAGSGNYRLEKRNASGYSIDGGNGGANGQNLYLWSSNNNNQNQHWKFSSVNKSAQEVLPITEITKNLQLYPNPASNELNISLASELNENAQVIIYSAMGKTIVSEQLLDADYKLSISNLTSGMYILQIINGSEIITEKFIKK